MPNIQTAKLGKQSYGIAMACGTFGGPRGIWLECRGCDESQAIIGSRGEHQDWWFAQPDSVIAQIFRRHGWTGEGDRMMQAKCPACSKKDAPREH